jgi:hypothetical protein
MSLIGKRRVLTPSDGARGEDVYLPLLLVSTIPFFHISLDFKSVLSFSASFGIARARQHADAKGM